MTQKFYDDLSSYYHLIFQDWEASIKWQSSILKEVIKSEWGSEVSTILDVSCGIGTQSIGFAQQGYKVTGSDLSPKEIERAEIETKKRGLHIEYFVSDMREVFDQKDELYDVLVSCDNSIPHLLSDEEILEALNEFYRCIKPGGGCLITVRDYEKEPRDGVQVRPYGVRIENGVRYLIFQTWEFHGDINDISMFVVKDEGTSKADTQVFRSKYYAIGKTKLIELMKKAGFENAHVVTSDFYQPVIVGTRNV